MTFIIMILLLSILILVHEAGHFFTARFFKMKVDKFGFGLPIGPTLFERKFGDVTICIHAFLLGGYVSFPDDDENCELPEDSEERFLNKPYHQKAGVVAAGVIANVICAFVLVLLTAALWGHLPSGKQELFVHKVTAAPESFIWQSGLKEKDIFDKINGGKIDNYHAFKTYLQLSKGFDGKSTQELIDQNYKNLKALNPALGKQEIIPEGVNVRLPQIVYENKITLDEFEAKGAKYHKDNQIKISNKALQLRDILRKENKNYYHSTGEYTLSELAEAISDNCHPLNITVLREGKAVELNTIYLDETGKLGIEIAGKEIHVPTKTPWAILTTSFKYLIDNTYTMLYGLGQVLTGNVPLSDLHGVVAITKIGGDEIATGGIFPGLLLTALISMNLALINFLPIPALDGGHFLFMTIERITGRKINEKVLEKIASTFFMLLILLMVYVIFNDIMALINHKF